MPRDVGEGDQALGAPVLVNDYREAGAGLLEHLQEAQSWHTLRDDQRLLQDRVHVKFVVTKRWESNWLACTTPIIRSMLPWPTGKVDDALSG